MKESAFASAVRLIEDALGLARRADSTAWLVYVAGVVPFFGLLLFAMTDLVQNPFAVERLPVIALALALLYCWLHICQSVFCGGLKASLEGTKESLGAHFAQAVATQPTMAASKLILWPVTTVLLVPYPAVTMFYQHSLIPAPRFESLRGVIAEAKRDALYRQGQTIWMLLLVLLLRAILWINLFGLLVLAPALWKMLTGIEGKLTRAPGLLVNPITLTALSILAYIGLDPIVKAACVLRRFARQSESSGLDLRLRVAVLARAAAVALVLCAMCIPMRSAAATAGQAPAKTATVSPDRMRQAIESVFRDPHGTWDLPVVQPQRPPSSPFVAFMNWIVDRVDAVWNGITSAIVTLLKALHRIFSNTNEARETKAHPVSTLGGWAVIIVFSLLLAGAILASFWNRRKRTRGQAATTAVPAKAIDLAREDVHAIDQPEDEWLRLAQQHRAAGNLRLALRALYLSTLAAFGRSGLISLARGKSNLDYLRELQRRAKRLNSECVPLFSSNLSLFEESWYGNRLVTEKALELFERNSLALRKLL
ncbi:MAG TPA: hypothetical protein VMF91_14340 [Bryobacteraceae bacterium]|nr:hypothetical protein [Bryobacteraceae bacterium]